MAVQTWEKNRITKEKNDEKKKKKKKKKKKNISLQRRRHLALYMIHLIHPYQIICVTIHNNKLRPLCLPPLLPPRTSCPTKTTTFHTEILFLSTLKHFNVCLSHLFQKINTLFPTKTLSSLIISCMRFFFFSPHLCLHFASGVLPAGWSVARWGLLARASCALVRLPLFAGLVHASGTWLSASARLLGTRDYAGIASALLAATGVTLLFECSSDVVS